MFKTSTEITIGCDPEIFLQDKKGKFVSSHDKFPGTKHQPFKVRRGAVQVDGVAFEFNIKPAKRVTEFLENVATVIQVMNLFAAKAGDYKLVVSPTAIFDQEYFDSLPEEAKRLGCEPDYNAYTGEENRPPETTEPFRTGSGHIHVGWTEFEEPFNKSHYSDCLQVVKQLDAGLFIPSLLWDNDRKRRELYGKMGAFRPKSYGVEYRPLSNAWVADPDLGKWVFESTLHSMKLLEADTRIFENKYTRSFNEAVSESDELDREDYVKYLFHLVSDYNYPDFPEEYL